MINSLKFDVRLYILVTSINPLKIYIYQDGIVSFATEEYTECHEQINNKFIHLTNYSINKNNTKFSSSNSPYSGHRWSLNTLWNYFSEKLGIDWKPVWENMKDICVKTILCGHVHMRNEAAVKIKSDYNCYKIFGFDILLDSNLKPWLLEVKKNSFKYRYTNQYKFF